MKLIHDILRLIATLIPFILEAELSGGTDKKSAVVTKVCAIVDEPGGLDLPSWISGDFRKWLVGVIIDILLKVLPKDFYAKP